MRREIKKYLFDIKTSVDSIEEYLGDKRDFTAYQKNKLLRRGIEREIEIIGEAMNHKELIRILRLKVPERLLTQETGLFMDMTKWTILLSGEL